MRTLWLWLLALSLGPADGAWAQEVVQDELHRQQGRLESLQREIAERRAKTDEIAVSKRTVLEDLAGVDRRIEQEWDRLQATKKAWTEKELALLETQESYRRHEQALDSLKVPIERRLRAYYQLGTIGTLNVLFAAQSVPELLSRGAYLRQLLSRDQQERSRYRERLAELKTTEARLTREHQELSQASKEIEIQALTLEERKREKEVFLQELGQQGDRYETLLAELEAAKGSLEAVIGRLYQGTQTAESAVPPGREAVFFSQKGKLPPPIRGRVVNIMGDRVRGKGIVLAAPVGTEIRAVFDGRIIFRDVLTGYGNVLVLDHGDHYYSLVGQAAKLFKKVGEDVKEGEILGLVGGGPWVAEGIYFEIRHGGTPEDPLLWLDRRMLAMGG